MAGADLQAQHLVHIGTPSVVPRLLYVAARLGLADRLATGPLAMADLAGELGVHPEALQRLARALAAIGVVSPVDVRYALTDLGQALRAGAPGDAHAAILLAGSPWYAAAFDCAFEALRTGVSGFETAHGIRLFDYLRDRPTEAAMFSATMRAYFGAEADKVAAAYDFSGFTVIADVGGASGRLLASILARYPSLHGFLFDMPSAIADADGVLRAHGVRDRVEIMTGDAFAEVPRGAEVYLLSHVLHDWAAADCVTILKRCCEAMEGKGRLLVIETVLDEGTAPQHAAVLDMVMLLITGGRERSALDYTGLFSQAGLRLSRLIQLDGAARILEAVPI